MITPTDNSIPRKNAESNETTHQPSGLDGTVSADGGLPGIAPTRQVLIVGDGITGLALTLFLERAGQDPVLLQTPTTQKRTHACTVWSPGKDLLKKLNTYEILRNAGAELREVKILSGNSDGSDERVLTPKSEFQLPVVANHEVLRDALCAELGSMTEPLAADISSVTERDRALEVEFNCGVREQFDIIVGTDKPQSVVRSAQDDAYPGWTKLNQLEIPLQNDAGYKQTSLDSWRSDELRQLIPSPTNPNIATLRITSTSKTDHDDQYLIRAAGNMASYLSKDSGCDVSLKPDKHASSVWQVTDSNGAWGSDRTAYCGRAAFPVAPGTGLQTALSLEDAWVLADELTHGPESTPRVVENYRRRRSHRIKTLRQRARLDGYDNGYPLATKEPLTTLSQFRAACLGSFCSSSLAELQEGIPNRL